MSEQEQQRLERIENKLDRLSEAVVSLARMEERMITLFNRMDSYDTDRREFDRRLAELERVSYGRGTFFRFFDRGFWLGVGLILALLGEYVKRYWLTK